jgi:repressor LexA
MMKLTKRQKEILDFLEEFIHHNGYSPSMEEIAEHFHIASVNAIYKHLESLKRRGFLRRDANRARSIELSADRVSGVQLLPLLGIVAAGKPIEAVLSPETMAIPENFLPGRGPYYVLKVQGDSMIDEHITDGDHVIVEAREAANDGEMVIALVDGENVTLKKLHQEGSQIRLQPANPEMAPIILDNSRVRIQGVVAGVIRKYR